MGLTERGEARSAVRQASLVASLLTGRGPGVRRVSLGPETGDPSIPAGGVAHLRPVKPPELRPGRLVLVRVGGLLQVRRFVRRSHRREGLLVHVAPPSGGPLDPPVPATLVLGEVESLEHRDGARFTIQLAGGSPVMNWLTDFGTCTPVQKLGRVVQRLVPDFRMR